MTLRVNLKSGTTEVFDFSIPSERERWFAFRQSRAPDITGLSFIEGDRHFAFPRPQKFGTIRIDAREVEHRNGSGVIVGFEIVVHADDVRASLLVYAGSRPKMTKFTVDKVGKPIHLPGLE